MIIIQRGVNYLFFGLNDSGVRGVFIWVLLTNLANLIIIMEVVSLELFGIPELQTLDVLFIVVSCVDNRDHGHAGTR